MDTRVPPDDAGWRAVSGTPRRRSVEERLEAIEDGLAAIDDRLSVLEASLTSTVAEAIGEELHGVSDDLRRAVSDLGRLMLRDLDRLTKLLAEHRDDIVTRLHAEHASAAEFALPGEADDDLPMEFGPVDEQAPGPTGEEGRWWALPGRRKRGASGTSEPK
jgi:hypothetical protein